MRKIPLILLIISALAVFGFTYVNNSETNQLAKVNQESGVYLFVESSPVTEYDYLGTVTNTLGLTGSQYSAVKNTLIKKALKKYPEGDAIIFHFSNEGIDKADIIKFKQ